MLGAHRFCSLHYTRSQLTVSSKFHQVPRYCDTVHSASRSDSLTKHRLSSARSAAASVATSSASRPFAQAPNAPASHRRRSVTAAALQGICFDKACQDAQDQIFLAVIAVPLLCLAAVVLYAVFRRQPADEASRCFACLHQTCNLVTMRACRTDINTSALVCSRFLRIRRRELSFGPQTAARPSVITR